MKLCSIIYECNNFQRGPKNFLLARTILSGKIFHIFGRKIGLKTVFGPQNSFDYFLPLEMSNFCHFCPNY